MKIHKVWAVNCGKISEKRELDFELTGNTFVFGNNEIGKSTLAKVPFFLIYYPTNNASGIEYLRPVAKDVATELGMEYSISKEVDGKLVEEKYRITQTYFKSPGTVLEPLEPRRPTTTGKEGWAKFRQTLDEGGVDTVLLNMLQVAQGKSELLFTDESKRKKGPESYNISTLKEIKQLQTLLDRAVAGAESDIEKPFIKAAESEYLKWFTDKGKPTTAAGTSGRGLSDLRDQLAELEKRLDDKRAEKARFESKNRPVERAGETVAELQEIQNRRDLQREQSDLTTKVASILSLENKIADAKCTDADLAFHSSGDYAELENLYPSYMAANSALRAVIKSLSIKRVNVDGRDIELGAGEISEPIPVLNGTKVVLPDVAEIEFSNPNDDSAASPDDVRRFTEILEKHSISDFRTAKQMITRASEAERQRELLETNFKGINRSELEVRLGEIKAIETADEELWNRAKRRVKDVTPEEYAKAGEPEREAASFLAAIAELDIPAEIDRLEAEIESTKGEVERRELDAEAIKMIWETMNRLREESVKDYSSKFGEVLNEVAKRVFGPEVSYHVTEDFEISYRVSPEGAIFLDQLSTGAREQLTLLIRVALAQLASPLGGLPLILDDEFAHSDEPRIELFRDLLEKFDSQQVLIFSCYPKKFESWPGKRITLAGSTV